MSRIRKAAVTASFGYLQFGLALCGGLVLVPLVLGHLGARTYGLWLASGELLGYAAMVDLGVLGVLPWMLAEADGRRDRESMRALLANGLAVGVLVGAAYALLALGLWLVLPAALGLAPADRRTLAAPLALLVGATMVAYPFRVFAALLSGVQDVVFTGGLAVAQAALNIAVTLSLLSLGYGLLALSVAAAASAILVSCAALVRALIVAPDLLTAWPRPSWTTMRTLVANGSGVWLGAFGWQMLAASNGLVIAGLGRPEWVSVYACSAKLSAMAAQVAWIVPDAGLIGLAQVNGEGHGQARLRALVTMMVRLHLLLAGAALTVLLAASPAFVSEWVGPDLFGGLVLNAWLALGVVSSSLVHGLFAAASVVGQRMRVGALTLVNGAVQVCGAWLCGRVWGLPGVAAAAVAAGLLVALPAGVALLRPATGLTLRGLWTGLARPWIARAAPVAGAAALLSVWSQSLGLAAVSPIAAGLGLVYLWHLRPLYVGLPADPRLARWMTTLRLVPAHAGDARG